MHDHEPRLAERHNTGGEPELPRRDVLPTLASLQRTAGNRAVTGLLAVQRQRHPATNRATQPGAPVDTPFGRFWVTTDRTAGPPPGLGIPTAVTPSRLAELQAIWHRIETHTGKLLISDMGHAGFRARTLARLAQLMSRPYGQRLVEAVVNGPQ